MITRTLALTLKSDVVVTRHSATVGGPGSLDRIPGAMLLGAAAARLYRDLGDRAFEVFHAGAVQFGDGLPVGPGGWTVPVPLCIHTERDGDPDRLYNLARHVDPEAGWRQRRVGWMGESHYWTVPRTVTMRTAIDPSGRAREGLLYGLEALPAGLRFEATLRGHDEDLLDRVVDALCPRVRLGRSSRTEFGDVAVAESAEDADAPPVLDDLLEPGRLLVLCMSDLCLRDAHTGAPSLQPGPRHFGLPAGWTLDPLRSFVRYRRYSPFNAYRRRSDLERQVIVAGSVLSFTGEGALDLPAVRRVVAAGVGEHREQGLGAVLVEPALLADRELRRFTWRHRSANAEPDANALDGDHLFTWLVNRARERAVSDRVLERVEAWVHTLSWTRLPRSQWSAIRQLAQRSSASNHSTTQIRDAVRQHVQAPEGRHAGPDPQASPTRSGAGRRALSGAWGQRGPSHATAADELVALVDAFAGQHEDQAEHLVALLEHLAVAMSRASTRPSGDHHG